MDTYEGKTAEVIHIWVDGTKQIKHKFHIRTVQHLDIIKVLFIHQLMHQ